MTEGFPYLAMDSAGKRTVLCDYPVRMFERHKEKKMKIMSHAHRVIDRLLAHDADLDDEGKARVKEFLKNKLSAADHETLCSMLAGEVEAQDTEPPPDDVQTFNTGDNPPPLPGTPRPMGGMDGLSARQRMQAADSMINKRAQARDSFFAMFPDQAKIRIDNSGIQPQPRGRAASYSADGAASFAAMFPDAMKVRLL